MPETTEAISGLRENISEEPVSVDINSDIVSGMDPNIYRAAVNGNIDNFKEKGEDVEFLLTPNKNTILHIHFTAYSDRVSEAFVKEILRVCPLLLMKANAKSETLLHIAARYGHFGVVRRLIESAKALPENNANAIGAEKKLIRATNDKKDTALHEAVCYHHTGIVKILIEEDPDHSYLANSAGETPLYLAAERAYWDAVQKILEKCKSPNINGPNGRTALHAAVIHNNTEIVSKLLTTTSAKQADENGCLPLHLAAFYGYSELTELLLHYDRNTAYFRDKEGRTALHFAAYCGHVKAMEMIIEYCPDCSELVDEKGKNALHYAVTGNNRVCARIILTRPSLSNLYNEKDDNGNTPLHHLSKSLKVNLHLLIGHPRVDTMAFNKQNQTVVDVALANAYDEGILISKSYIVHKLKKISRLGRRIQIKNERIEEKDNTGAPETKVIAATLITTVTFAAGFSLPGGTIQEGEHHQGSALLRHNPAFQAFIITDCIALVLSTSSVLIYFFMSNINVRKYNSRYSFYGSVASRLTVLAMLFMIIAFVTGTYAVLSSSEGIGVVTLLIGLSFFFVMYKLISNHYKYNRELMDIDPHSLVKHL